MKNKETLGEAAEKSAIEQMGAGNSAYILGFIQGVKHQQEQDKKLYNEEDMREAFIAGGNSRIEEDDDYGTEYNAYMEGWFEKLKKK